MLSRFAILAGSIFVALPLAIAAQSVNVDFGNGASTPAATYDAAGSAGTWNSIAVLQPFVRDATVAALSVAAAGDSALDPRIAALLSMTGPAHLLEVVAPNRSSRRHARDRIDHALDGTSLESVGKAVRSLISDAAAAATTVATTTG